jgi:ubiquinone/menaquinone biosynthesis C-methylase UbiE
MKIDYDVLAREYAQHRQVQPEVLKHLIQTGNLTRASQVLEVGCGTGNYTIALLETAGCSCWGIDPSEQMLAIANKRSPGAHFILGRAEQLDYPAEFFDLVFSVDVIHHVGDRSSYFREACRLLKKGGKVCTVTDSTETIRHRQPLSVYFPETIEVDLHRYPGISDLCALMVAAGFSDLQETVAEFAYPLADIQVYRDRAFSCLHLIPTGAFERGIQRMEQDLRVGPIPCVSRYLLLWGTTRDQSQE